TRWLALAYSPLVEYGPGPAAGRTLSAARARRRGARALQRQPAQAHGDRVAQGAVALQNRHAEAVGDVLEIEVGRGIGLGAARARGEGRRQVHARVGQGEAGERA